MRTGVVLANILALDAAAELALAFVAVVAVNGIGAIGEDDGTGGKWLGITKEIGSGHWVEGDFKEIHQGFVFVGKADDKLVVYATVLHNIK